MAGCLFFRTDRSVTVPASFIPSSLFPETQQRRPYLLPVHRRRPSSFSFGFTLPPKDTVLALVPDLAEASPEMLELRPFSPRPGQRVLPVGSFSLGTWSRGCDVNSLNFFFHRAWVEPAAQPSDFSCSPLIPEPVSLRALVLRHRPRSAVQSSFSTCDSLFLSCRDIFDGTDRPDDSRLQWRFVRTSLDLRPPFSSVVVEMKARLYWKLLPPPCTEA